MAEVFGGIVKEQGLDPSLLEMKAHTRVSQNLVLLALDV